MGGRSPSFYGGGAGAQGGSFYGGGAGAGGAGVGGSEMSACGVGCGGNPGGDPSLSYVGCGQGAYVQDSTFRYVGYGGDFGNRKKDFTCLITCCTLPLLLLIPCLLWWLCQGGGIDCDDGFETWELSWGMAKQEYCCRSSGRACSTTRPPTPFPTPPPTPPPTQAPAPTPPAPPPGPVDPFNCAVDAQDQWAPDKKEWCCRIH